MNFYSKEFSSRSSYFNYDTSKVDFTIADMYNLESCFKSRDILKFNLVFPYKGLYLFYPYSDHA